MKFSIKKILLVLFALVAIIFEMYFSIISGVGFILQSILIATGVYLLGWMIYSKRMPRFKSAIVSYSLFVMAVIGFFLSVFLSLIYYQNTFPAKLADIVLSNSGGQHLVFLEMSHIATPEFYREKNQKIQTLAKDGYTILVEGVQTGSLQSQKAFHAQIGFNFTPTLYAEMADLIGLQAQDKSLYAGVSSGSLVSVDLSLDDIVALSGSGESPSSTYLPIDLEKEIQSIRTKSTEKNRAFIAWIMRAVLNWSLKGSSDISSSLTSGSQKNIFDTIIHKRNDRIVEYIRSHPDKKITIVYGALHFNGVYEALQKSDTTWHTVSVETYTPYNR